MKLNPSSGLVFLWHYKNDENIEINIKMKLSAFFLTTGALSQDEGSGQNSGESNTDSTLSFTTNPKAGFLIFDWLKRSRWFHVRGSDSDPIREQV